MLCMVANSMNNIYGSTMSSRPACVHGFLFTVTEFIQNQETDSMPGRKSALL